MALHLPTTRAMIWGISIMWPGMMKSTTSRIHMDILPRMLLDFKVSWFCLLILLLNTTNLPLAFIDGFMEEYFWMFDHPSDALHLKLHLDPNDEKDLSTWFGAVLSNPPNQWKNYPVAVSFPTVWPSIHLSKVSGVVGWDSLDLWSKVSFWTSATHRYVF